MDQVLPCQLETEQPAARLGQASHQGGHLEAKVARRGGTDLLRGQVAVGQVQLGQTRETPVADRQEGDCAGSQTWTQSLQGAL